MRYEKELQETYWYRIDDILKKKSRTLQDLAEETGIKYPTILSWRSRKKLPDLASALAIAQYFGVSIEYFLEPWEKGLDLKRELQQIIDSGSPDFIKYMESLSEELNKTMESTGQILDILRMGAFASTNPDDKSTADDD